MYVNNTVGYQKVIQTRQKYKTIILVISNDEVVINIKVKIGEFDREQINEQLGAAQNFKVKLSYFDNIYNRIFLVF